MSISFTRSALKCILIPIAYIGLLLFFVILASITEFPTDRSGIYVVFIVIAIILLILLPVVTILCAIISIINQVMAFLYHEPKGRIFLLFITAIGYILMSLQYSYLFYLGIISA